MHFNIDSEKASERINPLRNPTFAMYFENSLDIEWRMVTNKFNIAAKDFTRLSWKVVLRDKTVLRMR